MPSAHHTPLDSTRPRPVPESCAQNLDAPGQRFLFLVLFRTLLGIAMAHTALGGPDRDHIIGLIRALIDRLEQRRPPAPSTDPTQTSHPTAAAILARAGRRPGRNQGPAGGRRRRPRAEPAAPPPLQAPHCASANQVRGPPRHPRPHQRPSSRDGPPTATSAPDAPRTAVWRHDALRAGVNSAPPVCLEVDRPAVGVQHRLVHGFAHRRVREHGVHQVFLGGLQGAGDRVALDHFGNLGANHVGA